MFKLKLKELREKNKLSQQDVALKLNISPQSISKWERGEALPSVEYFPTLAKIFNCSINYLFGQEDTIVYIQKPQKDATKQNECDIQDKMYIDIKNALEQDGKELSPEFFIENQSKLSMLKAVIKWLGNKSKCSISRLQRNFKIGYARAASIQDGLMFIGVVGQRTESCYECAVIKENVKKAKQVLFC